MIETQSSLTNQQLPAVVKTVNQNESEINHHHPPHGTSTLDMIRYRRRSGSNQENLGTLGGNIARSAPQIGPPSKTITSTNPREVITNDINITYILYIIYSNIFLG
jgi:hypothetical protein